MTRGQQIFLDAGHPKPEKIGRYPLGQTNPQSESGKGFLIFQNNFVNAEKDCLMNSGSVHSGSNVGFLISAGIEE